MAKNASAGRPRRHEAFDFSLAELTSESPAMQRCLALAREAAKSDLPLLLQGETGTGKTLLARAIHIRRPDGNEWKRELSTKCIQ